MDIHHVDHLATPGLICDLITPPDPTSDPYAAIYLRGNATIEITDPCEDEPCVQIIVKTDRLETTIYLPEGITLTSLDSAICSAIMSNRARNENR